MFLKTVKSDLTSIIMVSLLKDSLLFLSFLCHTGFQFSLSKYILIMYLLL